MNICFIIEGSQLAEIKHMKYKKISFITVILFTLLTQILMVITSITYDYEAEMLMQFTDYLDHPYVLTMYIITTTENLIISLYNLFYAEKLIRLSV